MSCCLHDSPALARSYALDRGGDGAAAAGPNLDDHEMATVLAHEVELTDAAAKTACDDTQTVGLEIVRRARLPQAAALELHSAAAGDRQGWRKCRDCRSKSLPNRQGWRKCRDCRSKSLPSRQGWRKSRDCQSGSPEIAWPRERRRVDGDRLAVAKLCERQRSVDAALI